MIKKVLGIVLIALLFAYGVIRVGVGSAMLAQAFTLIDLAGLSDSLVEVTNFLEERESKQIVPFSVPSFFAYIVLMGVFLTIGALGLFMRKFWGFVLLGIYIILHGALFINYQEVNPKLWLLAAQILALFLLFYLRPPKDPINDKDELAST